MAAMGQDKGIDARLCGCTLTKKIGHALTTGQTAVAIWGRDADGPAWSKCEMKVMVVKGDGISCG